MHRLRNGWLSLKTHARSGPCERTLRTALQISRGAHSLWELIDGSFSPICLRGLGGVQPKPRIRDYILEVGAFFFSCVRRNAFDWRIVLAHRRRQSRLVQENRA